MRQLLSFFELYDHVHEHYKPLCCILGCIKHFLILQLNVLASNSPTNPSFEGAVLNAVCLAVPNSVQDLRSFLTENHHTHMIRVFTFIINLSSKNNSERHDCQCQSL